MSIVKISALPLLTTATGATVVAAVHNTATMKLSLDGVFNYVLSDLVHSVVTATSFHTTGTFIGNLTGTATYAVSATTVTAAAQPAITSVGTLTNLDVSGTVTAGALVTNYIDSNPSTFNGSVSGTTLTVTNCPAGTIALKQTIECLALSTDTYIISQLTGTNGGNGTYKVSNSQNVSTATMEVKSMYVDADIKLGEDMGIYIQDEDDPTLYDNLIGVYEADATVKIGSINTNGIAIDNAKEYKVESALNTGTYMAVASVNTSDSVILSSNNANTTEIKVGGISANTYTYGAKLFNGGQVHVPTFLRAGDNPDNGGFSAQVQASSIGPGSSGGFQAITYNGTATIVGGDEWGSFIYGTRFRGTLTAPLAPKANDWIMEFGAAAGDGSGGINGGGELAWRVDGAVSAGINPSRAELYVTPQGTASQTLGLVVHSSLQVEAFGTIKTLSTTATSLPSASTAGAGARAFITDATTTTFLAAVAGSGTYKVPVVSNGTSWVIG